MEAVVGRENMWDAYARVLSNKGAAGVDGISVHELGGECKRKWVSIREELLEGRYVPQPVLGVEIPKPGGGVRQLGIPTVMDRLIQQALHQVLTPIFDPGFSESSYGFRRDEVLIRPCCRPSGTSGPEGGGSWTWTSRSSSTA